MRKLPGLAFLALTAAAAACAPVSGQGGANPNDRTGGGNNGDLLLTGGMILSPDGAYAVMQRNTVTVLVDVAARTATQMPFQGDRFVFSRTRHVLYAVKQNRAGVVALDLDHGMSELWSTTPVFVTTAGALLMRVRDDDSALVLGDYDRAFVLDPQTGSIRGTIDVGTTPTDVAFLKNDEALVVGSVTWTDHKPETALVYASTRTLASSTIQLPNCDAPIAVLPDESRALLSPTYCEEGQATQGTQTWTNPDPVSVIDLAQDGPHFVKNLPGFGPVALTPDGSRAVAYLDTKRMDPSMFDDKSQVPGAGADEYHLMVIDPKTLAFTLTPIGDSLPRFAMTLDGKGLLVDASVATVRAGGYASVTIGPDGLTASAGVFGGAKAPFGYFDLGARAFTSFQGPGATLDRFVQTGDAKHVYTLKLQSDGLGGQLFDIDLSTKQTADLQKSLRDIGILPDGHTVILRIRLPAANVNGQLYTQEDYCFSQDAVSCDYTIHFQATTPVQDCSHDCY